jgi:lipopolysaccharide transport system permease protein
LRSTTVASTATDSVGPGPEVDSGSIADRTEPTNRRASLVIIEAGRIDRQYWRDLWAYRELLYFLAWRDIAVRYKQTVLGAAWAVIRPLLPMVVLVIVFSWIAQLPSGGVPYSLLVLTGMLAWQLFASAVSSSGESLVGNAHLISKVYFPRLNVPLSSLAVSLVDFVVTLPVLLAMMVWYGTEVTWRLALFPAFVVLALLAALSVGLWLSALTVRYRDFRVLVPFLLQFGLYLAPVGYGIVAVPEAYRDLYSLNPMVGIVEGFRWSLLGQAEGLTPFSLGVSVLAVALTLISGLWYFRRTERTFADII